MAYFPDLSPCTYFGEEAGAFLYAIGWLESDHPIPSGQVSLAFFEKLMLLCKSPWRPELAPVSCGIHPCSLCRFNGVGNQRLIAGCTNVFIPFSKGLFVFPELLPHYISAHNYAPPPEFVDAVMACPPMRSMDYLKQILPHLPTGWRTH